MDNECSKCPYYEGLKNTFIEANASLSKRVEKNEKDIETIQKDQADIKEKVAVTREQTTMIFKMLTDIKFQIGEVSTAVKELEKKPGTQWEKVIWAIISAVAVALVMKNFK